MRLTGLWAAAVLCMAAPVSAATYTVAPTGSDSNSGSASAPFNTLAKAVSVLRDGDSIVLRAGTYAGGVSIGRANVTIESYPGEVATISASVDGTVNTTLTLTAGAINARVRRLKILGGVYYSLKIDGDKRDKNTLIEECTIGQSGRDCVKLTPGSDGVTFRRCEIGFSGLRDGSNAEGIDNVCADRMVVQDCWVHDTATNGIYPKGGARQALIERTRVENCGGGGVFLGFWTDTEWFDQSENPRMFENLDSMVRNCVIVNTKGAGIGFYSAQNARVFNNTLVNVGQTMHGGIVFSLGNTTTPSENVQFMNNVVIQPASSTQSMIAIRPSSYSGGSQLGHNSYWKMNGTARFEDNGWTGNLTQWKARTSDAASVEGDPLLDTSHMPRTGSLCIRTGVALADVTDDFRGTVRLGLPDVGAFQTTVEPTRPAAPAGLSATAAGDRVNLKWTAGQTAGYRVYRSATMAGSYTSLGTGPGTATTYADTAIVPGGTYWYQLTAVDAAGTESLPTAPVQATVPSGSNDPPAPTPTNPQSTGIIYADSLLSTWASSTSKASASLSATSPVAHGTRAIALTVTGTDGFLLLQGGAVSLSGKTHLKFFIHGGAKGSQQLRVRALVNGVQQASVNLWSYGGRPEAGEWVECTVPLADLGAASGSSLTGLKFSAGKAQKKAYLDHIRVE